MGRETEILRQLWFASEQPHDLQRVVYSRQSKSDPVELIHESDEVPSLLGGRSFELDAVLPVDPEKLSPRQLLITKHLDAVTGSVYDQMWRVHARSNRGWRLELVNSDAVRGSTKIELSSAGSIERILTGGISFESSAGSGGSLDVIDDLTELSPTSVQVIGALEQPRSLSRLTLRFHSADLENSDWRRAVDQTGLISLRSGFQSMVQPADLSAIGSLQMRTGLNEIGALLDSSELCGHSRGCNINDPTLIPRLTSFVYHYLTYDETVSVDSIAGIIKARTGDCTEHAKLFNALGLALGLTTRVVYGLAFDELSRSFRGHAWNEVAVNDQWLSVDPTWNQAKADATHLPYPNANTLALLRDLEGATFEVVATDRIASHEGLTDR